MTLARHAVSSFIALVITLGPLASASAQPQPQPTAGDLAIAKGEQAMAAFDRREWEQALLGFIEADKLYHSPVFSLYQARSLKAVARLVEATAVLESMRNEALPDAAPESWVQAKTEAAAELVALKAELPRVVIVVRNAPGALATLDGQAAIIGTPLAADAGEHRVTASNGKETLTKMVTLRLGAETRAVLDFAPPSPPLPPPRENAWRFAGIALTSVGGAGLIAGGIFGGLALDRATEAEASLPPSCSADKHCPTRDQAAIEGRYQAAYDFSHASDGLFIAGGAIAAAGIIMLLVDAGSESAPVQPSVGPRGLMLRF